MSGVRSIGGAALLLLVLLGVLSVLAQTAEDVPTELYVRTIPSGATIIVDGRQQGTSPRLFEVDPGEHSVTVRREGYQPKTETVTIRKGRIRRVILELSKGPGGAAIDSLPPHAKPRQVRLPHADRSREHGTPAVLDLASGELIAQPKTADDEAIAEYWDQLGRGDLAYPGEGLMVLRRGVVEQWSPTTRRFTPAKAIYQEPRGATKPLATGYALEDLPLRFRMTSGDGKKFDVTVLERGANGDYIEIEYRALPKPPGPAQTGSSVPVETKIVRTGAADNGWGRPVEGVQCRLRTEKVKWDLREVKQPGRSLRFQVDFRNRSDEHRSVVPPTIHWHVEWDGESHGAEYTTEAPLWELPPGGELRDRPFGFPGNTFLDTKDQPTIGRHTVRVAFALKGTAAEVFSNPVEIEVLLLEPAVGDEGAAWGEPVDGVQVRLGAARLPFEEGQAPVLRADVRNRGNRDLFMWEITVNGWQIQVDGQWYRRNFRNTLLPNVLSAGGEVKNLKLTFETRWQDQPVWVRTDDEKRSLRWRPGKHTVRVAVLAHHPQGVDLPGIRAESNAVQIEILPKNAAAKSTASPPPKLSTRKLFSASHAEDTGILAVAFSADGRTVAAVDEAAKVILRDARSGRQTISFDLLTAKESEAIFNAARRHKIHSGAIGFSPEGEILAVAAGPMVKLYDAATGRFKRTLHDNSLLGRGDQRAQSLLLLDRAHGSVHCLAFSPDGRIIATGGSHWSEAPGPAPGCLKVWDAATGDLMHDVGEHFGEVRAVAFSPDGKELISVPTNPRGSRERGAAFWNPLSGRYRSHAILKSSEPWSVAYSPDGLRIAAGCIVARAADQPRKGFLLVWDARAGASMVSRGIPGPVASVAFSADGKTLATGVYGRGVTLRDAETLEPKGEIPLSTDPSGNIEGTVQVAFSPTGNLLAVGAKAEQHGFVMVWEIGQEVGQGEPPVEPPVQDQEVGHGEPAV